MNMNSPVYILWLRQVKKYFRSRSRIVGALGQPTLFLIALGFGFGPVFAKAGGGNYLEFLVPGIIALSILFTATFSGIEVIWDRQFGFLKETLVAPVNRTKIMLGRTLGGATVAVVQGLIVMLISLLLGFQFNVLMLPVAVVFMFLLGLLFTALGTAIASLMEDMQGFQLIINFLIMPLFFLSNALFPVDNLPGPLAAVTQLNPLSYGVDGMRGALTGVSQFGLFLDFSVLAVIVIAIMLIGGKLFSKIQA
ncbi:ABC-2 type transporter [uncultured archaeon]|nr:ABC-2 type transporter [uncultured archaeon]